MKQGLLYLSILILVVLVVIGRNTRFATANPASRPATPSEPFAGQTYTLQTSLRDGRMVYVGVGGAIDGVVNPDLVAHAGTLVRVTLINGDGMSHDFSIGDLGITTSTISAKGTTTEIVFSVTEDQAGTYDYFCTVSGHRQAGMAGKFVIR